jgi:hypothetical protein
MTTATTVLGLMPLALGFGEGSQLQAPMAITIIGGQITGTILLLLAIPSIYKVVTKDTLYPDTAVIPGEPVQYAGSANLLALPLNGRNKMKNSRTVKPVYKLILRLLVIVILAAVIIYLAVFSGQDISMVIQ